MSRGRRSRGDRPKDDPNPESASSAEETGGPTPGGGVDESSSDGDFARAMRGVKPLAGRDKVRPHRARIAVRGRGAAEREAISFQFPRPDEPLLGHAGGVQRRQLERLQSGRIRPDVSIDLHRLRAEEARAVLHRSLIEAHDLGQRCAVVIHGRGLHSEQDSVLKRALPAWLSDARVARLILAFAPARPEDGGEGATYVLLKRRR